MGEALKKSEAPEVSVVVPVYKEESNIKPFLERMTKVLSAMDVTYEILFCLDPSPDKTEEVIHSEIELNPHIKLVVFSRRFGQPAATIAGILKCSGKTCVIIDVDLQDPPEVVKDMYRKLQEGYEVVYAKRRSRKGETVIKRMVSSFGYYLINKLSDMKIPRDTGDFRIITRVVIEELRQLNEVHGFLRGLIAYIGFKQTYVEYDRDKRHLGITNYNRYLGSLKIGLNGLISFSVRPLQLMSLAGAGLAGLSFFLGFFYVMKKLMGFPIPMGHATVILFVTFFSGIQLLSLGLIGEYVGRIYEEVKRRPMYIVKREKNM